MSRETAQQAQIIDIGANLAHDSFDHDRDAVIARAREHGVVQMIVTGSSLESTRTAIELARAHPHRLYATAGVHPHHAADWNDALAGSIARLAAEPEVVAVGECGLDYFRDFSPRPAQRAAFHAQLEIAERLGKPVFLHQRDAHDDFMAVLREHPRVRRGVAHCFTGNAAELDCYLELGFSIGITGWINDERRGRHLLELVARIPAGRLMIETDAPYLLPRDIRPKPASRRNEPAYLPYVASAVAAARGEDVRALASSTTRAARELFGLPTPE